MQVEPIKPKLKQPITKRLKLTCDVLLPTSAFNFNVRRYIWELQDQNRKQLQVIRQLSGDQEDMGERLKVGAYTRPLLSST